MCQTACFPVMNSFLCTSPSRRLIGEGGFGSVYEEYAPGTGLRVVKVVKILSSDDSKSVEKEASILARMKHPYIPNLLNYSRLDDAHAEIIMQFVGSHTLLDILNRNEDDCIPPLHDWTVLACTSSAILHLHNCGIAHMDIKCENIVVDQVGRAYLIDYNLSYEYGMNEPEFNLTHRCGTVSYAAPEIFVRTIGPYSAYRSDVWSFGVVCFAIFGGHAPFYKAASADKYFSRFNELQPKYGATVAFQTIFPKNTKFHSLDAMKMTILNATLQIDPMRRVRMSSIFAIAHNFVNRKQCS